MMCKSGDGNDCYIHPETGVEDDLCLECLKVVYDVLSALKLPKERENG